MMPFGEFLLYVLVYGAVLTYICWGFVFAVQSLLLLHGKQSAVDWVKGRYTFKTFLRELKVFFPMIFLFHILLEQIPKMLRIDDAMIEFNIGKLVEQARLALDGGDEE